MMVLRAAEATPSTSFLTDDIAAWPPGSLDLLVAAGLLRREGFARSVECDDCEEHCVEEVELLDGEPGEPPRAFIRCGRRTDIRRIAVPLTRLRQWTVSLGGLAEELARQSGAAGGVDEITPGRLWWLGRAAFPAGRTNLFLARGVTEDDAAQMMGGTSRLQQSSRAAVLTTADTRADWLPGKVCISLSRLLRVDAGTGLLVDVQCIEDEVARRAGQAPRRGRRFPTPPGTTWEQVSVVILAGGEEAQVTAGGVEAETATMADMNLALARNHTKPTKLWALLVVMALEGGLYATDRKHFDPQTPKRVERLRDRLQEFFGIGDDPFKPYHQVDGYEPRFALSCIRPRNG